MWCFAVREQQEVLPYRNVTVNLIVPNSLVLPTLVRILNQWNGCILIV